MFNEITVAKASFVWWANADRMEEILLVIAEDDDDWGEPLGLKWVCLCFSSRWLYLVNFHYHIYSSSYLSSVPKHFRENRTKKKYRKIIGLTGRKYCLIERERERQNCPQGEDLHSRSRIEVSTLCVRVMTGWCGSECIRKYHVSGKKKQKKPDLYL